MSISVIIPCYRAAATLRRAVDSALTGAPADLEVLLVDDGSPDDTGALCDELAAADPRVRALHRANGGAGAARNTGLDAAHGDWVLFLDADDAYQAQVLAFSHAVMQFRPDLPALRLGLIPVDLDAKYSAHPQFDYGWRHVEMTVGGNMVFRRAFLLACGGFPQDELFRRLGGEDVALGLAVLASSQMGTAFDDVGLDEIAVLHHCRPDMYAYKLLDGVLFGLGRSDITEADQQEAQVVTDGIVSRLQQLQQWLHTEHKGKVPLKVELAPK